MLRRMEKASYVELNAVFHPCTQVTAVLKSCRVVRTASRRERESKTLNRAVAAVLINICGRLTPPLESQYAEVIFLSRTPYRFKLLQPYWRLKVPASKAPKSVS
eukprot:4292602-Amphidinium_carterae.1